MIENVYSAVGRRKKSIAKVRILKGKGSITINKRNVNDYFSRLQYQKMVMDPLKVVDSADKFDVIISVRGGGTTGQAGAIRHGISRALIVIDKENRTFLKKNGFLTRDPRMTERKKYGHKGARKSFQFSKR